jgi:hypothetical protein
MSSPAGEPLTIDGVTRTIPEWAREKGISRQLLRYRVKIGMPAEALFSPPRELPRIPDATIAELKRRVAAGEPVIDVTTALGINYDWGRRVARGLGGKRRGVEASP